MMRSVFVFAALCVALCAALPPKSHELSASYSFADYCNDFGKSYSAKEHAERKVVFERSLKTILSHNQQGLSWKMGVNHLTDRHDHEFKSMLGYDKAIGYSMHKPSTVNMLERTYTNPQELPKSVDWRTENIVTAVKDQGECGSCWTFATAETLESHWARKTGMLFELSEQHVLDCVPNPEKCGGTGGCQGGTAELAYKTLKGIDTEWKYPYQSYFGDNFKCKNTSYSLPTSVTGYTKLPSNQYDPLMEAVATLGPIAISVEALPWKHYESGIFDGCNKTSPDIDHAVQLVGYGEEEQADGTTTGFWLVRNSWGPIFGEKGYIRLRRDLEHEQDNCGIDDKPLDGSGCAGGPPTVKVCGTCGILFDTCYPTID